MYSLPVRPEMYGSMLIHCHLLALATKPDYTSPSTDCIVVFLPLGANPKGGEEISRGKVEHVVHKHMLSTDLWLKT